MQPFWPALRISILWLMLSVAAQATTSFQSLEGYLHYGGGSTPQAILLTSSPEFISLLDPDNLGSFYFEWLNLSGGTINNLAFTLFLDPDIDRDANTFFNEYGQFLSLSLPVLAPVDAIAATNWEIDEPGYTYGDIYNHVYDGVLDNLNGVPSSAPDDVSHALQFLIPSIFNGQSVRFNGTLSLTDAAGLAHVDPDSNVSFYFNGYALLGAPPPPTSGVPEPGTAGLLAAGIGLLLVGRGLRRKR